MNKIKEFQVIEPPIYNYFNWDMGLIMKGLEYLRVKLPDLLIDLPPCSEYYLINYGDFLGNSFPAIGIHCHDPEEFEKVPDFLELYDRVETWVINDLTLEKIKTESLKFEVITWNELKELNYYPNDKCP